MFFGFLSLAFGFWGLNTPAGQARFDEMDGMYPFFAGVAGGVLFAIGVVLVIIVVVRG